MNLRAQECVVRSARAIFLAISAAFSASPALAGDWAQDMFQETSHDFGTLACGSHAEYCFTFQNKYREEIRVASVDAGCGATAVATKDTLQSRESAQIVARLITTNLLGPRLTLIRVTFAHPYYAQVQLRVSGFVRGDVVVEPGVVDFGRVERGKPAEQRIKISYAGRPDWKITDVRTANYDLEAELVPSEGERTAETVTYQLLLRLHNAPLGGIDDDVTIVTDDETLNRIRLAVKGKMESAPSP